MITLTSLFFFLQIHFHGTKNGSVPGYVPDSTIPGISIYEKLQNIYNKNVLFLLHIEKVEEYQNTHWGKQLRAPLLQVKERLLYHLGTIKSILTNTNPDLSLPPTPGPLQLPLDNDFKKKVYGWGVIFRLKEWVQEVLLVLEEMKNMCNSSN